MKEGSEDFYSMQNQHKWKIKGIIFQVSNRASGGTSMLQFNSSHGSQSRLEAAIGSCCETSCIQGRLLQNLACADIFTSLCLLVMLPTVLVEDTRTRAGDRAPPPLNISRFLGIVVVNQKISTLIEAVRQLFGDLDAVEWVSRLVKYLIHLLERASSSLREEEIHTGCHGSIDYSKDDVSPPSNVCKGDRCDHNDHEVEGPVCGGGDGVCRRTNRQRCNLSRVKPGHPEPSNRKEGVEDEEHDSCNQSARLVLNVAGRSRQDGHCCTHADSTEDHQLATSKPLDGEDGDPGSDPVLGSVASS